MSLSSKFSRLKLIGVIGFLAFSLIPFKVFAASTSSFNTSFDNNLFQIVPSEQTSVLRTDGCEADAGAGIFFALLGAVQVPIGGSNFTNRSCAVLEAEKAGVVNLDKIQGEVNVLDTIGSVNNFILNQRPASTVDYVQDKVYALTGRVNAAEPAPYFAGGTGYQLLEPIQAFWGWSVNVVYAFLILIIIGIAFAIVFRQKIGGKEMVTIQSAIPSIAMAMILVPLSYAISGFFIDLIGIGANTVHAFFFAPGAPARSVYEGRDPNTCDNNLVVTDATGDSTGSGTTDDPCDRGLYIDDSRFEWYNFNSVIDITDEVEGVANTSIAGQGVNSFFLTYLIKQFLDLLTGSNKTPAYWFGEIINAVLLILMIWVSGRIAWRLLKKYLTLILTPIASPFIFASVAVPGNGMNAITNFAKSMGSASLHFIVTYALFVITLVFTSNVFADQLPAFSRGIFIPPILGLKSVFESLPVSGSESLTSFMFGVIGMGVFFSIPSILDNIDKSLGVKEANLGFIKAPIDALKDSYIGMRYTAPGVVAKTAVTGGRLAGSALTSPGRTLYKGLDLINAAQGITPDDPRSFRSRLSRQFGRLDKFGQGVAQRGSQNRDGLGVALGNVVRSGARLGAAATTGRTGGVGEEPSIKASFRGRNSTDDNFIVIRADEIENIIKEFGGSINRLPNGSFEVDYSAAGGVVKEYIVSGGSLNFEAQNGLTFYPPTDIRMYNADAKGDTDLSSPRDFAIRSPQLAPNSMWQNQNVFVNIDTTAPTRSFQAEATGFTADGKKISEYPKGIRPVPPGAYIGLFAGEINDSRIKSGTNISVPFDLGIAGDGEEVLKYLLGQSAPGMSTLNRSGLPDNQSGALFINSNIRTARVGFAIGPVASNTVQIRIKV